MSGDVPGWGWVYPVPRTCVALCSGHETLLTHGLCWMRPQGPVLPSAPTPGSLGARGSGRFPGEQPGTALVRGLCRGLADGFMPRQRGCMAERGYGWGRNQSPVCCHGDGALLCGR